MRLRTARICLNLNLIMAPQACLEYVIIHELCHIKVRHTGPDFWNMVRRYVPDYLALRKQLREFHIPLFCLPTQQIVRSV